MKVIDFPKNDRDFKVQYYRTREGPNWFLCYYKNAAKGVIEPLDAWRTLGVAKNMETGKLLKQWCLDMHEQYGAEGGTYGPLDVVEEAEGSDGASEGHDEGVAEASGFFDTKMIT